MAGALVALTSVASAATLDVADNEIDAAEPSQDGIVFTTKTDSAFVGSYQTPDSVVVEFAAERQDQDRLDVSLRLNSQQFQLAVDLEQRVAVWGGGDEVVTPETR